MESSAAIAENKSSAETKAETNLTANDLDPLVYFSRFLGIPETILNHLNCKDLLLISEISPSWYNCIASSRDLMEKIKVVFNDRRELQKEDYDLMKNSSRKYQNIEVARRARLDSKDAETGREQTLIGEFDCMSTSELDFFLSKDWKNVSIKDKYFKRKLDLWKFLSSIESSVESFSINNRFAGNPFPFDDESSSNIESFEVLNFPRLIRLKLSFWVSSGEIYLKFFTKSVAIEKFNFRNRCRYYDSNRTSKEMLENFVKLTNLSIKSHQSKMFEDESWKRFKFKLKCLTICFDGGYDFSNNFRRFLESQSDHLEEMSINAGHDKETFTLIIKMPKLESLILTTYVDFSTDEVPSVISTSITHLKLEELVHRTDRFKFMLMSMPNIKSLCLYLFYELSYNKAFDVVDPNISLRRENKFLFNMIMRMQKLEILELKNFKVLSKDEVPTEISLSITHLRLTFMVDAISLKYLLNSMPNVKSLQIYVIDKEIFQVLLEIDREYEELKVVCLNDIEEEDLKIFLIDENDKCVVENFE